MHVAPKEVFTLKMWGQNESFLRYKKKEWLKFGTWISKSYIELWNVVALPNSNPGVFNLLSSRANLHLSYNPAGHSYCRLQNHHGYTKHHQRGKGGSPGDVGEVPKT